MPCTVQFDNSDSFFCKHIRFQILTSWVGYLLAPGRPGPVERDSIVVCLPEIRTTSDEFADVVSLKEICYLIRFGYLATLNLVSLNTSASGSPFQINPGKRCHRMRVQKSLGYSSLAVTRKTRLE